MSSTFHSRWEFADRVYLDGDDSLVGTVTGFCFRVTRDPTIEVSWMANGDAKSCWFEDWRLSPAAPKDGQP